MTAEDILAQFGDCREDLLAAADALEEAGFAAEALRQRVLACHGYDPGTAHEPGDGSDPDAPRDPGDVWTAERLRSYAGDIPADLAAYLARVFAPAPGGGRETPPPLVCVVDGSPPLRRLGWSRRDPDPRLYHVRPLRRGYRGTPVRSLLIP